MAKKKLKNKEWGRNANMYRRQARRLLAGHGVDVSNTMTNVSLLNALHNVGLTDWAKAASLPVRNVREIIIGTVKHHYSPAKYPMVPSEKRTRVRKKAEKKRLEFYRSREWRAIRYAALEKSKGCCECCGAQRGKDSPLHADHIIPRSIRPDLELDPDNVQILCEDCNLGKSNKYQTDWRTSAG